MTTKNQVYCSVFSVDACLILVGVKDLRYHHTQLLRSFFEEVPKTGTDAGDVIPNFHAHCYTNR